MGERGAAAKKKKGSMRMIFMHADGIDVLLMVVGIIGSIGDGLSMPLMLFITSKMMNSIGDNVLNADEPHSLSHNIDRDVVFLCYVGVGAGCLCFLEGYCWTRTAERQAARMRGRYLKAVLRQDVGYFDLHANSTSEVITSVSNDSLIIQDCISEKVPNFLMNSSAFIGSYLAAFLMLWRLAVVSFTFVVLLVIPGFLYGRISTGLATKLRDEYGKAEAIAEQAISSIRTVYSFVGENKIMSEFSVSLQGSVRLGLRQGLAKGLSIGSNGVVFAVWAFSSWYGSRLVMHHSAKGGTFFAVGASLTVGGLPLVEGGADERMTEVIGEDDPVGVATTEECRSVVLIMIDLVAQDDLKLFNEVF